MSQKEWNHPDEAKRLNSHKFYGDIVKIHQPDKYSLRISYQKDQERFDLKHLGDNWLHGGRLDPVHVLCIDLTPQGYTVYEETFERGINATRADIYDGGKNPKETEVKKSTFKDISNKALDEI